MTLDVVGSTPTIYPLKFISQLSILPSMKNNKTFKKTDFKLKYITYLDIFFIYECIYVNSIKSLYYFSYFKFTNINFINFKKYSYIFINKKKNHYYICVFENNKQLVHLTLGSMLKRLKVKKKYFRRTDQGFDTFINIFHFNFKSLKNEGKNIILVLNFIDFKFFKVKDYFFKKLFLKNFFFFKIKRSLNKIFYKKYKNIKKRLRKRHVKITLKQN